jgi:photosystem II stability/assembly factor-like uncharacterized protein
MLAKAGRAPTSEPRVFGRGSDFAWVRVDPRNPEVLYVANTSMYRSTDGGHSFTSVKGAPGGDDYHSIWINPLNPDIMLLGVDQGATITVNGGKTWSSWYNQPTAQFYHVIADNQFPYWVYGAQQESGSVGIASRSDYGAITNRDWFPVGVEEWGYVAPDPLNPDIVYGSKGSRFDKSTRQVQDITPFVIRSGKYRFNRTAPMIFSPVDPHVLYLGSNVLFKTTTGGQSWEVISPDLTRPDPGTPASLGQFADNDPAKGKHRGVIYSIAPSFHDVNTLWVGTDDGLVHLTRDGGKTWKNISPAELTPWSKLAQMEASHFDEDTVYLAVNRFRLDDMRPYIYRTHDAGKTWKLITSGLPNEPVNTVREDPQRKGLLFAGTERTVYVSFDDGEAWHDLQLNLPPTSIRDLVIHGDDIVVGTHGRSFWILDNITPLRQMTRAGTPKLRTSSLRRSRSPAPQPLSGYSPASRNADGPEPARWRDPRLLPERRMPMRRSRSRSSTPPGNSSAASPATTSPRWSIPRTSTFPTTGCVRRACSPPKPECTAGSGTCTIQRRISRAANCPSPQFPATRRWSRSGTSRSSWQLHGQAHRRRQELLTAPRRQDGPAREGDRGRPPAAANLELSLAEAINRGSAALEQVLSVRKQVKGLHGKGLDKELDALDAKLAALESGESDGAILDFATLNEHLSSVYGTVDSADAKPTTQALAMCEEKLNALDATLKRWKDIQSQEIAAINIELKKHGLPELKSSDASNVDVSDLFSEDEDEMMRGKGSRP